MGNDGWIVVVAVMVVVVLAVVVEMVVMMVMPPATLTCHACESVCFEERSWFREQGAWKWRVAAVGAGAGRSVRRAVARKSTIEISPPAPPCPPTTAELWLLQWRRQSQP